MQIYNPRTKYAQRVKPVKENHIGIYCCGMTVYDYCHIGHARIFVVFDTLVRHLRSQGVEVTYVRNITDVDDKIINKAIDLNVPISEVSELYTKYMNEDATALGCLLPDYQPKVTENMDEIFKLVQVLIDKGHAYQAEDGVYFKLSTAKVLGQLSNRKTFTDQDDFALLKNAKTDDIYWDSKWGKVVPGWHTECVAMSTSILGDTLDIHGGGSDLLFPHHENEILQAESATGEKYANHWMHVGFVNIDGQKMSKSLGNFTTIRDILKLYHPEVLRYFLISSHYSSPLNYSTTALNLAKVQLNRFYNTLARIQALPPTEVTELSKEIASDHSRCIDIYLNDDLNTPFVITNMFDLSRCINVSINKCDYSRAIADSDELIKAGKILGILQENPYEFLQGQDNTMFVEEIKFWINKRNLFKIKKEWDKADQIRKELLEGHQIVLEDTKDGTTWRQHIQQFYPACFEDHENGLQLYVKDPNSEDYIPVRLKIGKLRKWQNQEVYSVGYTAEVDETIPFDYAWVLSSNLVTTRSNSTDQYKKEFGRLPRFYIFK